MSSQTHVYYDKFYSFKDYHGEAAKLVHIIRENTVADAVRLLDAACGTGRHLEYLGEFYDTEGLDINPVLLECARRRNPSITFHCLDMIRFDLGKKYHVITCLFGSIGYVKSICNLQQTAHSLSNHLVPDGLLIIEPWFTPATWQPGKLYAQVIEEPELKLVRMSTSAVDGRISHIDFHILIGTPKGIDHHIEHHELGLFTREEMVDCLSQAGFQVKWLAKGLNDRDLILAKYKSSV
jgi:SAM-dependent methyltransferase